MVETVYSQISTKPFHKCMQVADVSQYTRTSWTLFRHTHEFLYILDDSWCFGVVYDGVTWFLQLHACFQHPNVKFVSLQFDRFCWKHACNCKNHVTTSYTTPKHQESSKNTFQLSIHPNNVHPYHNHSDTFAPCMHPMHRFVRTMLTKVCESAQSSTTTYHEPQVQWHLRALDTHKNIFIHVHTYS